MDGTKKEHSGVKSTCPRARAIQRGELVDITGATAQARIGCPIAVTRAVWEGCVGIPVEKPWPNEDCGLLRDVQSVADLIICGFEIMDMTHVFLSLPGGLRLLAVSDSADCGLKCITLMFPEELR
jgi:hypothetical protein